MEKAYFAAGCFWGVEEAFRQVEGVTATSVGYMGGQAPEPTYEEVCSGKTGHAEVVEVTYDPARVDYETLLEVFWGCHDPTQLNRQGPDVGTQYRSAIFTVNNTQEAMAQASKRKQETNSRHGRPVATQIGPGGTYWLAEDYHQQYFEKRMRGGVMGH